MGLKNRVLVCGYLFIHNNSNSIIFIVPRLELGRGILRPIKRMYRINYLISLLRKRSYRYKWAVACSFILIVGAIYLGILAYQMAGELVKEESRGTSALEAALYKNEEILGQISGKINQAKSQFDFPAEKSPGIKAIPKEDMAHLEAQLALNNNDILEN